MAVGAVAGAVLAAPNIIFRRPLDVIGDDEIEPAIFVIVKPAGAGGPAAFVGDPGFCSDVGEGAVAVVVIEDAAAVPGYVDVGIIVIVEVTDGYALAIMSFASESSFSGDIGEGTVAIVVVQRGAKRIGRLVNVGGSGLHEKEIHQAVLVVIEPGDASPHGFQIIFFFRLGGVLYKRHSRFFTNVGISNRNGSLRRFGSLAREQEQMGNRAEQCGQHQNRTEFSCEAENWSSNYFQFAPIPAGCVEDVPCWLTELSFNLNDRL